MPALFSLFFFSSSSSSKIFCNFKRKNKVTEFIYFSSILNIIQFTSGTVKKQKKESTDSMILNVRYYQNFLRYFALKIVERCDRVQSFVRVEVVVFGTEFKFSTLCRTVFLQKETNRYFVEQLFNCLLIIVSILTRSISNPHLKNSCEILKNIFYFINNRKLFYIKKKKQFYQFHSVYLSTNCRQLNRIFLPK